VIDTDIDVDHREFGDRVVKVIKDPDYPYLTPGNHGTQVTGIIAAARDGRGMVGIAPEARIVSTWLLDQDGGVPFPGPGGSLVSWFDRMERSNVQVINASSVPVTVAHCSTGLSNTSERSRTSEAAPSSRSPPATTAKISRM
jgi:subtilisin family serine protease